MNNHSLTDTGFPIPGNNDNCMSYSSLFSASENWLLLLIFVYFRDIAIYGSCTFVVKVKYAVVHLRGSILEPRDVRH